MQAFAAFVSASFDVSDNISTAFGSAGDYTIVVINDSPQASTYTFEAFEAACVFFSEETDAWITDGCSVSPLSTTSQTVCLCDHLTNFASNFVVKVMSYLVFFNADDFPAQYC